MRKDGKICIMAIDPDLCPALHRAAVEGILRPGHPIARIDNEHFEDLHKAVEHIRVRVKTQNVLITLGAPEVHSPLGHHLTMGWWQNWALASCSFTEDETIRESRGRVRQSASNTTADSYQYGHLHCAYI